jgi:hypothetical protein
LNGVPWELDELPRQRRLNPVGDIFRSPPSHKRHAQKPVDADLSINQSQAQRSPRPEGSSEATTNVERGDDDRPKKVPKEQINALERMLLSAL